MLLKPPELCSLSSHLALRNCNLADPGVKRDMWVSGLEQRLRVQEAELSCHTHPEGAGSNGLTVTLTEAGFGSKVQEEV